MNFYYYHYCEYIYDGCCSIMFWIEQVALCIARYLEVALSFERLLTHGVEASG